MKTFSMMGAVVLVILLCSHPALAQKDTDLESLREDIRALKEGQQALQKEIAEIKAQMRARPAPAEFKEAVIDVAGDPFKGNPGATLALIEISEFQCPFCARHARETVPQIVREYVDTGKIRYYFLDFPLSFHQQAFKAAEAAACAGDQGKFWEMHDVLFENQKALAPDDLAKYAAGLGLDVPAFRGCLDGGKHADEIRKDIAEAQKAGVSGTPTSLLGWVQDGGKSVRAVKIVKGAQPFAAFKDAIESLLATQK